MNPITLQPDVLDYAAIARAAPRTRDSEERSLFAAALSRAAAEGSPGDRARQAAAHLVAAALVNPVLKGLRESGMAAPPFAPGPAERAFGSIRDDVLARRLTASRNWTLIDRIAQRLVSPGGAA